MNNATEINQSFNLLSLVERDTTLRKAGGCWHAGPCPFCGGTDRFTLKQTQNGWRWFCRHCGEGKYHTPIDYVMRREGLPFLEAVRVMGGDVQPMHRKHQEESNSIPLVELPGSDWQMATWARVERACRCLASEPDGEAARAYLQSRGITLGTSCAYLLGAAVARDPKLWIYRPAVVIPWFDAENITALNFRFVDSHPEGLRYKTLGKRLLYGLNNLAMGSTLVLVEGEFNAMSIFQAAASLGGMGLDVLSCGSESIGANGTRIIQAAASRYEKVVTWFDDAQKAAAVSAGMAKPCKVLTSPVVDGVKYDANEMLKRGVLADFLRALELSQASITSQFRQEVVE